MMIKTGKTVIKPCLYFHCTDLSINGQRSANSVFESGVAKMTATSGEAVGYSQASYSVLREGSEAWHAPFSTTDCALLSHIQKTASLGFREHFDSPSSNPIYPVDLPWLSPPTKIWSSIEPLLNWGNDVVTGAWMLSYPVKLQPHMTPSSQLLWKKWRFMELSK